MTDEPLVQWPVAIVEGTPRRPEPGLHGTCPECHAELIAKCGPEVAWHFAHKTATSDCIPWSREESDWHFGWKARFPAEFHEVVVGRHRADVRFPDGRTIEVQHSRITPEQVASREKTYGPGLVWIFDATAGAWRRPHVTQPDGVATYSYRPFPLLGLLACELRQVYLDIGRGRLIRVWRQYEAPFHHGVGVSYSYERFLSAYPRTA